MCGERRECVCFDKNDRIDTFLGGGGGGRVT